MWCVCWILLISLILLIFINVIFPLFKNKFMDSLVQWLRICLAMQGISVQSLVREDATCHGATKPMRHNH